MGLYERSDGNNDEPLARPFVVAKWREAQPDRACALQVCFCKRLAITLGQANTRMQCGWSGVCRVRHVQDYWQLLLLASRPVVIIVACLQSSVSGFRQVLALELFAEQPKQYSARRLHAAVAEAAAIHCLLKMIVLTKRLCLINLRKDRDLCQQGGVVEPDRRPGRPRAGLPSGTFPTSSWYHPQYEESQGVRA